MSPAAEPPARRHTRLDTEERRAEILDAARRLFADRPFGQVSTTSIADAAGVTRGLVHHYFGTKRELYLAVVREMVSSPLLPLLDAMDAGRPDGGRLGWDESVDGWMAVVEADAEGWLASIRAGETGGDSAMHEILHAARERVTDQVLAVLALDEVAVPEVRALVRAFGAFAEHITVEWLDHGRLRRDQARVVLLETLPLLVDRLLPQLAPIRPADVRPDVAGARRPAGR